MFLSLQYEKPPTYGETAPCNLSFLLDGCRLEDWNSWHFLQCIAVLSPFSSFIQCWNCCFGVVHASLKTWTHGNGKSLWPYACEVISSAQLSWRVDWLPDFPRFRPAMGVELWLSMNKRVLDADRPLLKLLRPIGHVMSWLPRKLQLAGERGWGMDHGTQASHQAGSEYPRIL